MNYVVVYYDPILNRWTIHGWYAKWKQAKKGLAECRKETARLSTEVHLFHLSPAEHDSHENGGFQ